jgi:hypothetical protein
VATHATHALAERATLLFKLTNQAQQLVFDDVGQPHAVISSSAALRPLRNCSMNGTKMPGDVFALRERGFDAMPE